MLEETERVSNGAVNFDTQRVVDRLREGGWDEGQARALCDVLREIMRGVATKAETQAVKIELKAEIRGLAEKMDVQFQALRTETKAENQALRAENQAMQEQMRGLRQMMVIGFSVIATLMAAMIGLATLLLEQGVG